MPALPEQLLSVRLTGSGRAVLDVLWACAVPEAAGEAWSAIRTRDLVDRVSFSARQIERAVAELRGLGLIDRAQRKVAGRAVTGWRLLTVPLRRKTPRAAAATRSDVMAAVAKREESGTRRSDMVIIAKMAKRGDSERTIAERLVKARCKCSRGEWHNIKVHRRITEMRLELGLSGGMTAGDVAHRWAKVHELDRLA